MFTHWSMPMLLRLPPWGRLWAKEGEPHGEPSDLRSCSPRAQRRACVIRGVEGGSQAPHAGVWSPPSSEGLAGRGGSLETSLASRTDFTGLRVFMTHQQASPRTSHPRVRKRKRPQALVAPHGHWSQVTESRPHSKAPLLEGRST